MVKLGKMMWNEIVNANCQRASRRGSKSISRLPDINGADFVWTADLLSDELAPQVEQMMSAGITVIKQTLEQPKTP